MKRLTLSLFAACTGGERANTNQCPVADCSPATPHGLYFIGAEIAGTFGGSTAPAPTAIGGTQEIALEYDRTGWGDQVALDVPFTADDDGAPAIAVDHVTGSIVTVRGVGTGFNYLRILDASDDSLLDRKRLTGGAIDTILLVPVSDHDELPPGKPLVWAAGEHTIGVALLGQAPGSLSTSLGTERLVDTSMHLALAGADRPTWDSLHLRAIAGDHAVSVTAGSTPTTAVPFSVVDQADTINGLDLPATIPANGGRLACFQATNQGRFVVGLRWSYLIDGASVTGGNCTLVETTKTSGTVTVSASAGGQTMIVVLPVGT